MPLPDDNQDAIEQLIKIEVSVYEDLSRWATGRGFDNADTAALAAAFVGRLVLATYPDEPQKRAGAVRALFELIAERAGTPIITRGLQSDGAGQSRH